MLLVAPVTLFSVMAIRCKTDFRGKFVDELFCEVIEREVYICHRTGTVCRLDDKLAGNPVTLVR